MRSISLLVGSVLGLCPAASLLADWVALADGSRVQGVDFKKQGDGYLFTVESGKTAFISAKNFISLEKSPPGETVLFREKEVKLAEMIHTLAREHKARMESQERAVEKWAAGGKASEAARAEIDALAPEDREACFGRMLVKGSSDGARRLAAKQLGGFRTERAARLLAASSVVDPSRAVRNESVNVLAALEVSGKGEGFLPYLLSGKSDQRLRASDALRSFPTYRAVPPLVLAVHKSWNGGQRSFIFKGEQRSYISDYELVSGGTGFSIIEVADPVISTSTTGVILDVQVSRTEERFHLQTLEKITHRSFGSDLAKWQEWWKSTGEALALTESLHPDGGTPPAAAPASGS